VTARVRFVDSISTTAGIRLDVQVDPDWAVMRNGLDLSPAALRSLAPESMMRDGAPVVATARGNMLLRLPILLKGATADGQQSLKSSLDRECDRPLNFLEWRTLDATESRWLVCYRSAVVEYDPFYGQNLWHATVELHCQPFAYGTRRDLDAVTVNNDPAAASNPNYWDITGIAGDVETPLLLKWTRLQNSPIEPDLWAVRRRGTPANVPFLLQAEAQGDEWDTTAVAGGAGYSGAGSNIMQTTFATTPGMAMRLSIDAPVGASVDRRGTYRVFLRCGKTVPEDVIDVRLTVGATAVPVQTVRLPVSSDTHMVDLGLVQLPSGDDPVTDGVGGAEFPVTGFAGTLEAQRVSGTGNLNLDYLLFVPADDRMALTRAGSAEGTTHDVVFDTGQFLLYKLATGTLNLAQATGGPEIIGGGPVVSPGVTNRLYYVHSVGQDVSHGIAGSTDISVAYYPRYLSV
jgi:hypothetical protein